MDLEVENVSGCKRKTRRKEKKSNSIRKGSYRINRK
jgi:hypothetical protein